MATTLDCSQCTAIVAVLAVVITAVITIWQSKRATKEGSIRARQQYHSELRIWANSVMESMSRGYHLVSHNAVDVTLIDLLTRISAEAEQGRLFIPDFQRDKRRLRPRLFDWVVMTYNLLEVSPRVTDKPRLKNQLFELRRGFRRDLQDLFALENMFGTMKEFQKTLTSIEWLNPSQDDPAIVEAQAMVKNTPLEPF
jgi:hypothetical protein